MSCAREICPALQIGIQRITPHNSSITLKASPADKIFILQLNLASVPPKPSSTNSFANLEALTKLNKSKLLSLT